MITLDPSYIKLGIAALLPTIAAAILYLIGKKTPLGKTNYWLRQIICGILFGGLAVLGTEWGIPINGAQVNCRDAAVLVAGLMFGAPAGVIAGVIGGVERYIAVAWGVGTFTRIACSVSTIIAGIYSAMLRKFMFENKKPGWLLSGAIGVVMEVFHLTMVFLTNMNDPERAMAVVKACTTPMVVANGLSVLFAAVVLTILCGETLFGSLKMRGRVRISQTIQRWLLIAVLLAFLATSYFVFSLQNTLAKVQADTLLSLALDEVDDDIADASDANLLRIARSASKDVLRDRSLMEVAQEYGVTEVSVVDKNGFIVDSNISEYIGFDMATGPQSSEFLCLLNNATSYVQVYGPITSNPAIQRKYAGVKTPLGFIQIGADADQFRRELRSDINEITKNRHVGETGFVLLIDGSEILSGPSSMTIEQEKHFSSSIISGKKDDETFEAAVFDELSLCRVRHTEGYVMLSVLPKAEALRIRNVALYVNSFMEVLVFAVLFGLIYLLIKRVVVNQLKEVNTSLGKITEGDLDEVVNVRTNQEFASLSDDINSTVDTLKTYIAEASARIDKELEFAKNIQSSALPSVFPAFPKQKEFDIYAAMDPAKEVGGDFYDLYMTDGCRLHFLVADVSGKGIPAAMFMMRAKTELKRMTENGMPLGDVFTEGNADLCEGNDAGMFVTAWQGGLDLESGVLDYANAGHNPPLIYRAAERRFDYLRGRAGFVLGGMEGVRYKQQQTTLLPGDIVFLYTDGVTEATNTENELYGEERLLDVINRADYPTMEALCLAVRADVDAFVGEADQFDDITMLGMRYNGTTPLPTYRSEKAAIDDIPAVTAFVEEELEKIDCPMKIVTQLSIAIDEIYSNIVNYGYPADEPGEVTVRLRITDDPHTVQLIFIDEGIPYNPLTKEAPDITLSAEERKIGGLGIYMVRKSMDDVKYRYENDQNELTLIKNLP